MLNSSQERAAGMSPQLGACGRHVPSVRGMRQARPVPRSKCLPLCGQLHHQVHTKSTPSAPTTHQSSIYPQRKMPERQTKHAADKAQISASMKTWLADSPMRGTSSLYAQAYTLIDSDKAKTLKDGKLLSKTTHILECQPVPDMIRPKETKLDLSPRLRRPVCSGGLYAAHPSKQSGSPKRKRKMLVPHTGFVIGTGVHRVPTLARACAPHALRWLVYQQGGRIVAA
eukprot:361402-Chlamydomonas_euryale.AAC.2